MSTVFSSCVPCDMLMRTPLAPAAISCSTISGSRDAGPSVIKIFARLKSLALSDDVLLSRNLQSGFDCGIEIHACFWSKASKTLHELTLSIKHEGLRHGVAVGK